MADMMLEIKILTKNSEEFIWALVSGTKPLKNEHAFEFRIENFHGRYNDRNWICKLKPGLFLTLMDVIPCSDVNNTIESREDCLRFVFFLSGKGRVDYELIDQRIKREFADGLVAHSYVAFSPEVVGTTQIIAQNRLLILSIYISPALLLKYFNGKFDVGPYEFRDIVAGSDQTGFFHTARISGQMFAAIDHILNCPYSGSMRRLFIESKAMELITYKIGQMIQTRTAKQGALPLKRVEYERIKQAAQILAGNPEAPPGLFDLAKAVGTTHTQLNIGFKKMYGTTAFGYLRQIRLEKAKQLLESGRLNVTLTAYEVGYNSIPSFSKAFSSHFGMNPAAFIKKTY
jgi:AraC family transcriptional regulator, transcriptional activator of the genes for pyochelin and ferripyochelin receptors